MGSDEKMICVYKVRDFGHYRERRGERKKSPVIFRGSGYLESGGDRLYVWSGMVWYGLVIYVFLV